MVVAALTVLGIGAAALLVGISVYQNYMLVRDLGLGRNGTLLFWQKLTLKIWVWSFLLYVLAGTVFGGVPTPYRRVINLTLVALLITQALWESAVTHQWRKRRGRR